MAAPSTPCIDVCVVEPATDICVGCGRTIEEITRWSAMTEPERLAVMAILRARLKEHRLAEAATGADARPFAETRRS